MRTGWSRGRIPAMLEMASALARRRYPSFVYGRAPDAGELPPVFTFHRATRSGLEPLLQDLEEGGFRTLDCDEYLAAARGESDLDPARSVLLTFDDGEASVGDVLYPLLRRYGMKAVVFLIPGRIQEEDPDGPLCDWSRIREMHRSGLVDFQSHTLMHHRVFTESRIRDFVRPALVKGRHPHDLLLWEEPVPARPSYPDPPLGAPLYGSRPRMRAGTAYRDDRELRDACVALVREAGGGRFFERPDWRRALEAVVRRHRRDGGPRGGWETEAETREALRSDLATAKELIERNLPGKRVCHLAWPWGVACGAAVAAARETGHAACFWGKARGGYVNVAGQDPMLLARIGEDFVRRLPGERQLSLRRLLLAKARGRTTSAGRPEVSRT